jgi:hypothetical protein
MGARFWSAILIAAMTFSFSAFAAGIDSRGYTCAGLHALVAANRFVFINYPSFMDFVVANGSYCTTGEIIQLRSVPTSDDTQCLVNRCRNHSYNNWAFMERSIEQPGFNHAYELQGLQGKLTVLEIACHRYERRVRLSLAWLIDEHEADAAGDSLNARTTAVHNRCAIYYPQLPALFRTPWASAEHAFMSPPLR